MMKKSLIVFCCCLAAVFAAEKYSSKYDNLDIKEIMENDRLLNSYFDCIMERGKCTPQGHELREHLQEALDSGCEKCTEVQENGAYTMIEFLIEFKRAMWDELTAKFDPTGKYRKIYEERAREKGIVIPK